MNIEERLKQIKKSRLEDGEIFIIELFEKIKIKVNDDNIDLYVKEDKILIRYIKNYELQISKTILSYLNEVSNITNFEDLMKKYIEDKLNFEIDVPINLCYYIGGSNFDDGDPGYVLEDLIF